MDYLFMDRYNIPYLILKKLANRSQFHLNARLTWGRILFVALMLSLVAIAVGGNYIVLALLVPIPAILFVVSWGNLRQIDGLISDIEEQLLDEGYKLWWDNKLNPQIRELRPEEMPFGVKTEVDRIGRIAEKISECSDE